jgi:hypothetical protein
MICRDVYEISFVSIQTNRRQMGLHSVYIHVYIIYILLFSGNNQNVVSRNTSLKSRNIYLSDQCIIQCIIPLNINKCVHTI